jgi:hypothetical protein
MRIRTAKDYRDAVNEVQRLDGAEEGTAAFRRRHALLAAMAEYEQDKDKPKNTPGKPVPFSVKPKSAKPKR